MQNAPPGAQKKSNTFVIVLIVVVVGLFAIIAVIGFMAASGIYGTRKYLSEAKASEGKVYAQALARGMVSCADKQRDEGKPEVLPVTAPPVPPALADVSGKKYQSQPSEWTVPSYACALFSMTTPQYFQYQWVRDRPDHGVARAIADLDGNGSPDRTFEVDVNCTPTACTTATLIEK